MDTGGGAEAQIRPEKPLTAIFLARIFDQRPPSLVCGFDEIRKLLGGRWSKIRAKKNFRTKNPSLFAKFGVFPPHAISAGAVFGHFLPKKGKKWPKSALSLYSDKKIAIEARPPPNAGVPPCWGLLGTKEAPKGGGEPPLKAVFWPKKA